MKYIISTLGCKVNQYETQAMENFLHMHGHERACSGESADAVIINTCAVTAESGRKSRQTIRRLKDENPGAIVAVCGCFSQLSPENAQEIGADVIFGSADREKFIDAVERAYMERIPIINVDEPFKRRVLEHLPAGAVTGRTRAMLKIQDGCVNFCSYCIIPYTRGRLRSQPVEEAAAESARLAAEGFGELVLTGIEIASYGVDLPARPHLADVITACAAAAPNMRIRLGSIEPTVITEEFCKRLSEANRLCRHFHLSLQSGCDKTLKAMNRKYDTARFYEATKLLRKYFPGCALTADLITGFPGESDEDHAATLEFIRKCRFADMHIFPYSRRPGTPADTMPGQLTLAVKTQRAHEAQCAAEEMKREYLEECVGKTLPVLFETQSDGVFTGHADNYVPVAAEGIGLRGKTENVRIISVDGEKLFGEII